MSQILSELKMKRNEKRLQKVQSLKYLVSYKTRSCLTFIERLSDIQVNFVNIVLVSLIHIISDSTEVPNKIITKIEKSKCIQESLFSLL